MLSQTLSLFAYSMRYRPIWQSAYPLELERCPARSTRSKSAPSLHDEWPISPLVWPAINCGVEDNRLWRRSCHVTSIKAP